MSNYSIPTENNKPEVDCSFCAKGTDFPISCTNAHYLCAEECIVTYISAMIENNSLESKILPFNRIKCRNPCCTDGYSISRIAELLPSLVKERFAAALFAIEDKYCDQSFRNLIGKQLKEIDDTAVASKYPYDNVDDEIETCGRLVFKPQVFAGGTNVGLDNLQQNLEEYLQDLSQWKVLNNLASSKEDADLSKAIADLSRNKSFAGLENLYQCLMEHLQDLCLREAPNYVDLKEDAGECDLSNLYGKLQENKILSRIIKLQDDKDYLNDVVIKSGWLVMKGHKEWKKRWFRLAGNRLSFYADDCIDNIAGFIQLDQGCDVVRHKAVKEDENSKKVWPIKVTVGDRKLFVRAATKKERHSWFAAISSKIAHLNYSKYCEEKSERPDTRLVGVLNAASVSHLDVSNRPITEGVVAALVKGVIELESLNLQKTGLSNEQFNTLSVALEKLSGIKYLNISNNNLDSSIGTRFIAALKADSITDIDISGNYLDDAFLSLVAPFLKSCSKLNTLNLSGCQFSTSGVEALVKALVDSEVVLKELKLSNNKLGDSGVAALVPLLAKKNFKSVKLAGNCVGDPGAEALAAALINSTTEEIDLSNNFVTDKGAVALKSVMESNNLINLNLSSNSVEDEVLQKISLQLSGIGLSILVESSSKQKIVL